MSFSFSFKLEDLELDNIGSWPIHYRWGLILPLCIAFFGVSFIFFLKEGLDNFEKITQKRVERQNSYQSAQEKASHLEYYREQVKLVSTKLKELSNQLPNSAFGAEILEEISEHAKAFGLTLLSVKPMENKSKGFYMEYPIELTLLGTYHGLGQALSRISNMPRILTSHDIQIALPKNENKKEEALEIKLLVKIYWLKEKNDNNNENDILEKESLKNNKTEPLENSKETDSLGNSYEIDSLDNSKEMSLNFLKNFKEYHFFVYKAMDLPSPFSCLNRNILENSKKRHQEALEFYVLDSLEIVGFIKKEGVFSAILRDKEGLLHKANVGNYIGQNFGKIEKITEKSMEVKEWVQTPEGNSVNRVISIQLKHKDL